jgi:hypothetical protein
VGIKEGLISFWVGDLLMWLCIAMAIGWAIYAVITFLAIKDEL